MKIVNMDLKPNPFLHMTAWGFFGGIVLAILFMSFLTDFVVNQNLFAAFVDPIVWILALFFGGIPGLGLGFVGGFVLWLIMRGRPMPFSREDMQAARWPVYGWIGSLTFCGYFILIYLQWLLNGYHPLLFLPPIIAAIASAYAGHRYLFHMRLWSEQAYGLRKEKAKNEALGRLEDKPKNELYLQTDEDLENKQQL